MAEESEDRRKAAHCRRLAALAIDPRISAELLSYAVELDARAAAVEAPPEAAEVGEREQPG